MNANRAPGGFTLLELLVAVTITLVLAGLMLSVVTNTLNLWHRTQDNSSTSAQAKLALDMIERDLQTAVFRKDDGTWLAVDVHNTPVTLTSHGWLTTAALLKPATTESQRLLPDPVGGSSPRFSDGRFGFSGAWLRFITTTVAADGSLPTAVSYQIARRPLSGSITTTNPAEVRYTLFRSAVSAEYTLANGNEVTNPAYGSVATNPSASRSPATLTNPNNSDALATNVVDFGVWLYVRDSGGGLRQIFPADNSDTSHAARDTGTAPDSSRFPDVADVMVRILSEQGATLLSDIEKGGGRVARPAECGTDADWWWTVVETHSRVYLRRVEIKGASL